MAKEPERRYGSAGELAEDLGAYLDGRPISARSASSLYVIRKLAVKHSFETLVIASLFLGLLGFGALALRWEHQKRLSAESEARTLHALNASLKDLRDFTEKSQDATRANGLGWFLIAWRHDDLAAAQDIFQHTDAGTHAHALMSFLLDTDRSPEQLLAAVTIDLHPVAQLVIGERHLKRGEFREARGAFNAAIAAVDNDPGRTANVIRNSDIRALAEARLEHIHPQSARPDSRPAHTDSRPAQEAAP
jgi:hypothetical protein